VKQLLWLILDRNAFKTQLTFDSAQPLGFLVLLCDSSNNNNSDDSSCSSFHSFHCSAFSSLLLPSS